MSKPQEGEVGKRCGSATGALWFSSLPLSPPRAPHCTAWAALSVRRRQTPNGRRRCHRCRRRRAKNTAKHWAAMSIPVCKKCRCHLIAGGASPQARTCCGAEHPSSLVSPRLLFSPPSAFPPGAAVQAGDFQRADARSLGSPGATGRPHKEQTSGRRSVLQTLLRLSICPCPVHAPRLARLLSLAPPRTHRTPWPSKLPMLSTSMATPSAAAERARRSGVRFPKPKRTTGQGQGCGSAGGQRSGARPVQQCERAMHVHCGLRRLQCGRRRKTLKAAAFCFPAMISAFPFATLLLPSSSLSFSPSLPLPFFVPGLG